MIKGITVGVFDIFHLGHLNMIRNAKANCDHLTVAVHDDKLNSKGIEFLYSLTQRMEIVESIKFVDTVVAYERVDLLLEQSNFDIFLYGPDQNHQYFQRAFDYCDRNNKDMKMLQRTDGISSTIFRKVLEKKNV